MGVGLVGGCLRAPIGGDGFDDGSQEASSTDGTTAGLDDVDGLGMSGPIRPTGGDTSGGTDDAGAGSCHPSYVPCLPLADDLDCADVRALDAAPVEVIGEDAYGLDADHDGIGCES